MIKIIIALMILFLSGCVAPEPQQPTADRHMDSVRLIDQGTQLLRQGELDRAQAAFTVAFQLVPQPSALDGLGSVAYGRGDLAQAEKLFIGAYQMDPNYGVALANLALLYEGQGRYVRARDLYQQAEVLEPRNIRIRNNFAVFRAKHGDMPGSREKLLEAAAIADNPVLEQNIKLIQEER